MTDVKPFVRHDSTPPHDRSVAVLLVASSATRPSGRHVPGLLEPIGTTCLLDRALDCLEHVEEAVERAVWADDSGVLARFERQPHPGVRLLASPPDRCLRPGAPDAIHATHVLSIDGRHPLLRPSTLDEAIRLLRLRNDIDALTACVRVHGALYDLNGEPVQGSSEDRAMLLTCNAFSLVPAEVLAFGRTLDRPAFAFEVGSTEAFRVDTSFTQELASSLLAARASTTA